jgi:hypothetical protein
MRKPLATMALLCALMFTTSCVTGPSRLSRTWDDFYNQKCTESVWIHGVLLNEIIPVYAFVGAFAWLGDVIVLNTWTFWSKDAWDNHGTGFNHKALTGAAKSVSGTGME